MRPTLRDRYHALCALALGLVILEGFVVSGLLGKAAWGCRVGRALQPPPVRAHDGVDDGVSTGVMASFPDTAFSRFSSMLSLMLMWPRLVIKDIVHLCEGEIEVGVVGGDTSGRGRGRGGAAVGDELQRLVRRWDRMFFMALTCSWVTLHGVLLVCLRARVFAQKWAAVRTARRPRPQRMGSMEGKLLHKR